MYIVIVGVANKRRANDYTTNTVMEIINILVLPKRRKERTKGAFSKRYK